MKGSSKKLGSHLLTVCGGRAKLHAALARSLLKKLSDDKLIGDICAEKGIVMKEVKQLKMGMLQTPHWTKHKSVEIAVFSAESCVQNYHDVDVKGTYASDAIGAAKQWLDSGKKDHLKEQSEKAWEGELSMSAGVGCGGEAAYSAMRSAFFAIEAARRKSEKKAAKCAAKAIYEAALSKGWENPRYEGGMVGQWFMSEEDYNQELQRLRAQIKALGKA